MNRVETPQSRCRVAFARADITPPVGMYHRMWGAALHDRSTGVHRPLAATALWLESADGADRQLVIGLDHCLLDRAEIDRIAARVAAATPLRPDQVHVALSHTHGSGFLSRSRAAAAAFAASCPHVSAIRSRYGPIRSPPGRSSAASTRPARRTTRCWWRRQ